MPELAHIETGPPQGSCPSAEDLACYVDRTLSPKEAARVTAHLASCESCFEVYSEVLQFQLEPEPASWGKVVRFPEEKRLPPVAWWSSIAALLLVGLGFWGYFYFLAPPPALAADKLAASVHGKIDNLWVGETLRGAGEGEDALKWKSSYEPATLKVGAQMVNLQVTLQANNGPKTVDSVIPALLNALKELPGTDELQKSYGEITLAIEKGKKTGKPAPRDLLPQAVRLAQESRDYFDPLYFDLGKWVEAGRLATIARDPAFFQQPENRSFLRHVLWRDRLGIKDSKLPKAGRQDLDAIYEILDKSRLQPADYTELQEHFKNILNANYPE